MVVKGLKYWRKLSHYSTLFMTLTNKRQYIENKKCLQCFFSAKLTPSRFFLSNLFAKILHCKFKDKRAVTYNLDKIFGTEQRSLRDFLPPLQEFYFERTTWLSVLSPRIFNILLTFPNFLRSLGFFSCVGDQARPAAKIPWAYLSVRWISAMLGKGLYSFIYTIEFVGFLI